MKLQHQGRSKKFLEKEEVARREKQFALSCPWILVGAALNLKLKLHGSIKHVAWAKAACRSPSSTNPWRSQQSADLARV
jgi:hypothetical protein